MIACRGLGQRAGWGLNHAMSSLSGTVEKGETSKGTFDCVQRARTRGHDWREKKMEEGGGRAVQIPSARQQNPGGQGAKWL